VGGNLTYVHSFTHTQATAQAQQQPAGAGQAAAQAQCFWLYLDLFQAAPTQSAALIVAKEFKVRFVFFCAFVSHLSFASYRLRT
jgi:hypothetical protein